MSEELGDKLTSLKKKFVDGLAARSSDMAGIVALGKNITPEKLQTLQTEAHKIAGIAPLYGFDSLTKAAKDMDLYILENKNKFEDNFDEFYLQLVGLNSAFQDEAKLITES